MPASVFHVGRHALVPAILALTAEVAAAQEPMPLPRLTGPIVLDGRPDEPAWSAVPPLPMTMYAPHFGEALTERTEIRVAYDDASLYVGARLFDSDPRGVRTNTLYRDQYSGDDVLAIILDTYDDYETGAWFAINPSGARTDRALSNDAEFSSGMPMNTDWNTFWDAATTHTAEGWFAEMRIPFSSLGFRDVGGSVVMGMIAYRFIARKNERHIFPAIPPNWDMGFAKVSQAQRIMLENVFGRRPVYVAPYGLGGVTRVAELNGVGTAYEFDDALTREVGLDLRYSPTSNLSVDLTANTDFAQVEVDDQQVNLTRFSLFFPEKRQFFQERSAIFEFNTGGLSRLFHSRRIGLIEDEPVRLLGGARFVGRVGKTDLGFLAMQTARADTLAAENFGVLRLKRQVLNPYSTIGTMVTTRVATDGAYNVATGVDAVLRLLGDEYVTAKWVQTFENGGGGLDLDAMHVLARWERRTRLGFAYAVDFGRSGAAYNPGVGFQLRSDFTSVANELRYQWFPKPGSPARTVAVRNSAELFLRNADGTVESARIDPRVEVELTGGAELGLALENSYESVRDSFELSGGTPVPPGDYTFRQVTLRYMASRSAKIRPSVEAAVGGFYDGRRVAVAVAPVWNPSRHLELGADYRFNAIRFPDRDESLDVHLARLRVQLSLDVHLSLATFVQYNSAADEASVNARLRYNIREGRDLWIVYTEAMNTDRPDVAGPDLPFTQSRALMVKYTHTLVW